MATRTCPECGAQYVASVRRCIDCDVALVDEERDDVAGGAGSGAGRGDGEQIGYELEGWGNQLKVTLEGMLDKAGIRRVWEAGALVVAVEDEEAVDALIATVEGEAAELDDDVPRVAFDIEGMDADLYADLEARLRAEGIPHAWDDEGALVVAEPDEERVTAVVEAVLEVEGAAPSDEGFAATEALSRLYVAVDRLQKDPHDRKLVGAYLSALAEVRDLPVPYGFEAAEWRDLVGRADQLAAGVAEHADHRAREAWEAGAADAGDDDDPDQGVEEVEDVGDVDHVDDVEDLGGEEGDGIADDGDEDEDTVDRDRRRCRELRSVLQDYV